MSQCKLSPTSASWPSVLGRELPPLLGPGRLLCPAPASGWKSSLQGKGRAAGRAPIGHGSGEAPTGHFSTRTPAHPPPSLWISDPCNPTEAVLPSAFPTHPAWPGPGCLSPLGSGGGIRPSLTFSCSSFCASRRVWRRNFFCSFFVKYTPRVTGVSLSTGGERRPSGTCPGGSRGTQGHWQGCVEGLLEQPNPPSQGHTRGVELGRVLHQVRDPKVLVFL